MDGNPLRSRSSIVAFILRASFWSGRVPIWHTFAFWTFVVGAMWFLLQSAPVFGETMLFLGAGYIFGFFVHLFLLSIFVEGLSGRVPLALVVVPLLAYGGYYALYLKQSSEIAALSAQLRHDNPVKLIDFDPQKDALITANARIVASRYAIPVVYEPNDVRPFQVESCCCLTSATRCGKHS